MNTVEMIVLCVFVCARVCVCAYVCGEWEEEVRGTHWYKRFFSVVRLLFLRFLFCFLLETVSCITRWLPHFDTPVSLCSVLNRTSAILEQTVEIKCVCMKTRLTHTAYCQKCTRA